MCLNFFHFICKASPFSMETDNEKHFLSGTIRCAIECMIELITMTAQLCSAFDENCWLVISQAFVNESVPLLHPNALRFNLLLLVERAEFKRIQNQLLDGSQVLASGCNSKEGEVEIVCQGKCAPERGIVAAKIIKNIKLRRWAREWLVVPWNNNGIIIREQNGWRMIP